MESLLRAAAANYISAQDKMNQCRVALGLAKFEFDKATDALLSVMKDGETVEVNGCRIRNFRGTVVRG